MKLRYTIALGVPLLGSTALAADMTVKVAIPQLTVAEYHKPYVAMWLEKPDRSFVANLSVLYDVNKKNNGGAKWLKDMRQWWRKSGRELQVPVDGVTGATRAPGEHSFHFTADKAPLDKLPAGDYVLMVEAAREAGGREVVNVPFQWPPKGAGDASAKGNEELGTVTVHFQR
jgi:hypothetical protein